MTDFVHDQVLLADAASFTRAPNASVTAYDANDAAETTPLDLKDLNGLPLGNPMVSSADAFTPAFVTTSPQVKLVGGGLSVLSESYKGVRDEAVAAKGAAEAAAADAAESALNAQAPTDSQVDAGVARADIPGQVSAVVPPLVSAQVPPIVGPLVPPLVASALSNDPSVAAGAAALAQNGANLVPSWKAATAYAAGTRVIAPNGDVVAAKVSFTSGATYNAANWDASAQDTRLGKVEATAPKPNNDKGARIRDRSGRIAFGVDPLDGSVLLGAARHRPLSDNHPSVVRWMDRAGRVALDIRKDGNIFLGPREIHVFIAAGQSNMSGRGTPVGAEFDVVDQRILQYGAKQQRIAPATVPLDMHDTSTGLSPATVFAREYLKNQPAHVSVLIVPAAHGGCGFTTTGENPPPAGYTYVAGGGCWQVADQGPVNLYKDMVAQTQAAIARATELTGTAPKLKGLLWHQGEADSARLSEAQYATYFDALVNGLRTAINAPSLAVVVGEMSPDWTARNTVAAGVMAAHIQTPARFEAAGFAYGPPNTGRHGDDVHYSRVGIERLGRSMQEAYRRALLNTTGDPAPPPVVTGKRANGTLTIEWEQAPSRVTSYTPQYSTDGGATWTNAPSPSPALNTKTTVSGVTAPTALVRVSTTNATATSATTLPVAAIGA